MARMHHEILILSSINTVPYHSTGIFITWLSRNLDRTSKVLGEKISVPRVRPPETASGPLETILEMAFQKECGYTLVACLYNASINVAYFHVFTGSKG